MTVGVWARLLVTVLMTTSLVTQTAIADPIEPTIGVPNNIDGAFPVMWGDDRSDRNPVFETVPAHTTFEFFWTSGTATIDGKTGLIRDLNYGGFINNNTTDSPAKFKMLRPNSAEITDWEQILTDAKGRSSTHFGNIRKDSPWTFHSLAEISASSFRLPDLAPRNADASLTIYTAVNAPLYLASNPFGFLGGNYEQ